MGWVGITVIWAYRWFAFVCLHIQPGFVAYGVQQVRWQDYEWNGSVSSYSFTVVVLFKHDFKLISSIDQEH